MVISDSNNFFRELNAKNEGCMLRFQSSYHPNQQLNIETKMMKLIENEIEIMNSASHPCCESFYLLAQITRGYTNTKRNTNSNTKNRQVISSFSIPLHIDWKTLIGQELSQELIPFQFRKQKIQQSVVQSTVYEG